MKAGAVLVAIGVLMWVLVFDALPGGGSDDDDVESTPTPVAVGDNGPGATPPPEDDDEAEATPAAADDDDGDAGETTTDVYVVEAGDSLMAIADAHGVTLEELLAANPEVTDPTAISVGQEITIP